MVNDKKLDTSNASPDGPKPCPLGDACESAIYLREYMRVDAEHAAEKARRASGSARAECYACHWVESQDFARARVHTYRAGCCMVDAQGMRSSAASTDDAAYARRMADERNEWESRYRELAAEVLGYAIDQGIPSTDARSAVECIRQLRAALNKGKADPSHLIEMARGLHDAFLLVGHDTLATTMNQQWAHLHGALKNYDEAARCASPVDVTARASRLTPDEMDQDTRDQPIPEDYRHRMPMPDGIDLVPARKASVPVCTRCNDTHVMPAWDGSGETWPCTGCPTPCDRGCRKSSTSAYCDVTPCPCKCHGTQPAAVLSSCISDEEQRMAIVIEEAREDERRKTIEACAKEADAEAASHEKALVELRKTFASTGVDRDLETYARNTVRGVARRVRALQFTRPDGGSDGS